MTPTRRFLGLFCILALAGLACGISVDLGTQPSGNATQQSSLQEQVATGVAQTVQAFTQEAPSTTPTPTLAALLTATPTLPAFIVPPSLSVSVATNCYAGPSTNYGFVITLRPGVTATVVGKDVADNYWIIDAPGYPGTVCWLSGQYVSLSGETGNLPAPATPVVSKYTLDEPRNLHASCTSDSSSDSSDEDWRHEDSKWTVVLQWRNTDPDQTRVRVFRNGRLIDTLGAHGSSYTDIFTSKWHRDLTYGVQAYSSTAVSSIVTVNVGRCK
jgi:hypothetical protein